jgi:hypothetical protein
MNVFARGKKALGQQKLTREWFFLPFDTIDYLGLLQKAKRNAQR